MERAIATNILTAIRDAVYTPRVSSSKIHCFQAHQWEYSLTLQPLLSYHQAPCQSRPALRPYLSRHLQAWHAPASLALQPAQGERPRLRREQQEWRGTSCLRARQLISTSSSNYFQSRADLIQTGTSPQLYTPSLPPHSLKQQHQLPSRHHPFHVNPSVSSHNRNPLPLSRYNQTLKQQMISTHLPYIGIETCQPIGAPLPLLLPQPINAFPAPLPPHRLVSRPAQVTFRVLDTPNHTQRCERDGPTIARAYPREGGYSKDNTPSSYQVMTSPHLVSISGINSVERDDNM